MAEGMFEEFKGQQRQTVGQNKSDMMSLKYLDSKVDGRESVITPAFKGRMNTKQKEEVKKGSQKSEFLLDLVPNKQVTVANNRR